MPNLLLHICCSPCLCHPLQALADEGFSVAGLWYNPNVHPYTEYAARRESLAKYADAKGLKVDYLDEYPLEQIVSLLSKDRCQACYRLRLERTAAEAVRRGLTAFSSTLLYSIHQQHELVRAAGEEMGVKYSIVFLYRDFRPGWQKGREMAREAGLYRQQYCGCIFSERDRFLHK